MIVTCVYINVKPDAVNSFINATIANHLESVKEPGNLRFDLIQQADDPNRFMIYEAYESEEASAAHKNKDHYHYLANHLLFLRLIYEFAFEASSVLFL
jgi:autoinducer 2-degrading protein